MPRYTAVLDACVLVQVTLADTLLRVAEKGLYRPLWSDRILGEAQAAIEEIHPGTDTAKRFASMREAFDVHGQVAGLLRRPCPGRVRGHPSDVQPAGAVLDEHQHVQPFEPHGFHRQEVAGDERVSLGGEELPPGRTGPTGRGTDARGVQDLPHRGRGDRVPESCQLTLDSPVAPGRVLARHPDDQRLDRGSGERPPWPALAGAVPLAGDEVTVPAQDRGRGDREDLRPPAAAHQPRQRREPDPVGMVPPRPAAAPVTAAATQVVDSFQNAARRPDEIEIAIAIGVTLDAQLGAVISSASTGAHLDVTLRWHAPEKESSPSADADSSAPWPTAPLFRGTPDQAAEGGMVAAGALGAGEPAP